MSAGAICAEEIRGHFRTDYYLQINHRRLEHLASLGLDLSGKRVLELGAGIGDLTTFFLDRGCHVTVVEGRDENVELLRERFASDTRVELRQADLDAPPAWTEQWDIVFAYGVLYHLAKPDAFIQWMCERCSGLVLLSTCVTPGEDDSVNPVSEDAAAPSQALAGDGCRPSRSWLWSKLAASMARVYVTTTQPAHEEFPLDWEHVTPSSTGLSRSVFVGSREALSGNANLSSSLLRTQRRCP